MIDREGGRNDACGYVGRGVIIFGKDEMSMVASTC